MGSRYFFCFSLPLLSLLLFGCSAATARPAMGREARKERACRCVELARLAARAPKGAKRLPSQQYP
jgi:hypothetical protein